MVSLATGLLLGFLLGMRHALEPDHLAAVSVLMTRRGSATTGTGAGALLGAIWGVGHTFALIVVASVLAVIGSRLPSPLASGFELLVAAMMMLLGTRALVGGPRDEPSPDDRHGAPGSRWRLARRPLIVGLVHGLAGSGALTALVLARLPTATIRLCYVVLFGVGSMIGMACLTGLAGWPISRLKADRPLGRWLAMATGAFSLLLGSFWGWSAVRGLFGA